MADEKQLVWTWRESDGTVRVPTSFTIRVGTAPGQYTRTLPPIPWEAGVLQPGLNGRRLVKFGVPVTTVSGGVPGTYYLTIVPLFDGIAGNAAPEQRLEVSASAPPMIVTNIQIE